MTRKTRRNQDIREEARNSGIYLYKIAESMGISDITLMRKLRYEIPDDEKERIRRVLNELKEE